MVAPDDLLATWANADQDDRNTDPIGEECEVVTSGWR